MLQGTIAKSLTHFFVFLRPKVTSIRRNSKNITDSEKKPSRVSRPSISSPVNVLSVTDNRDAVRIKKEIVKPNRPPPAVTSAPYKPQTEVLRPTRPKSRNEVLQWWRRSEYDKKAGLDDKYQPKEWLHGKSSFLNFIPLKCIDLMILTLIFNNVYL